MVNSDSPGDSTSVRRRVPGVTLLAIPSEVTQRRVEPDAISAVVTSCPAHFSPALYGNDVQYWNVAPLPSDVSMPLLHSLSLAFFSLPLMHSVSVGSSLLSRKAATCSPASAASSAALLLVSRVVEVEVCDATAIAVATSRLRISSTSIATIRVNPLSLAKWRLKLARWRISIIPYLVVGRGLWATSTCASAAFNCGFGLFGIDDQCGDAGRGDRPASARDFHGDDDSESLVTFF